MLCKMCEEKPRSWDRYLAPLLFAYREVPQARLGFSPFERIYGRHVRGPLTILKEIWTQEELEGNLKTTYSHVLDLRNRLERTTELAHQNLTAARRYQKKMYDRKTGRRLLKVGDRALLLIPTKTNKLVIHWKGPYKVIGKKNEVDYVIDIGHTTKIFNINMLKKCEEREPDTMIKEPFSSLIAIEEEEVEQPILCVVLGIKSTQGIADMVLAKCLTGARKGTSKTCYVDLKGSSPNCLDGHICWSVSWS
ncbi:unnamed protein product [Ixodes persulcatus]